MSNIRNRFNKFVYAAEKSGLISPLVHIGQFKRDCQTVLGDDLLKIAEKDNSLTKLSKDMNVSEEVVQELEAVCNPSALSCQREDEVFNWEDPYSLPKDTGLITLESWKKLHDERIDPVTLKRNRLLKSKYTEMSCALHEKLSRMAARNRDDAVAAPETVINVCVCFPWEVRSTRTTGIDFHVLGTQKLTELRDRIPCVLDEQPTGDYSSNPSRAARFKLKDICTSSLFFVENVFYNDLRAPSSIDLSKYIREWVKVTDTAVSENTTTADMSKCCFNDLKVRLGCPYIFLHQGDCEHLVVFKDIRLFNSSDCQSRSAYPVAVSRPKVVGHPCQICRCNLSTWTTRWDELALSDPSVFCDRCFKLLHYDKYNNKLGGFVAFRKVNVGELPWS